MNPICLVILNIAALLAPSELRAEWLDEWEAELWYVPAGRLGFVLGSFRDAYWLRRNSPRAAPFGWFRMESPLCCALFLAALALVSLSLTIGKAKSLGSAGAGVAAAASEGFIEVKFTETSDAVRVSGHVRAPSTLKRVPVPLTQFALTIGLACLLLPVTTSLSLGDYPAKMHRRWIFLAMKIAMILVIAYCGLLQLATSSHVPIQGVLVGCTVAFRWALKDQRQRCPVCLHRLTSPARIGLVSQTFLGWYGTEFVCAKGHGLLHVPEIHASSSGPQRWLYLDPSWRELFSR